MGRGIDHWFSGSRKPSPKYSSTGSRKGASVTGRAGTVGAKQSKTAKRPTAANPHTSWSHSDSTTTTAATTDWG
jgi:hypothetical protein